MEKQIKDMNNVSDQILAKLQKDIEEIKLALLGNEYNPTAGIVYRMAEVERDNAKLKNRLDRIMYTAGGAAIILSVLFNVLMAWFEKVVLNM